MEHNHLLFKAGHIDFSSTLLIKEKKDIIIDKKVESEKIRKKKA